MTSPTPSPARLEPADVLEQLPLFRALPVAARAALLAEGLCDLQPREVLFFQDAPSDAAYLILSGVLSVVQENLLSGEQHTLGLVSRGDLLGEVGLLTGHLRAATVTAMTPARLLVLPSRTFDALLREHPGFAKEVARSLAGRLQGTNRRIGAERARLIGVVGLPARHAGALAGLLARQTGRPVGLTQWPDASWLYKTFGLPGFGRSAVPHPGGYHLLAHRPPEQLSADGHWTLLLDLLRQRYSVALVLLEPGADLAARAADLEVLIGPSGMALPEHRPPAVRLGPGGDVQVDLDRETLSDNQQQEVIARLQRSLRLSVTLPEQMEALWPTQALLARLFGHATLQEDGALVAYISESDLQQPMEQVLLHLVDLKSTLGLSLLTLELGGQKLVI